MVVAEVPMWVAHSSESVSGGQGNSSSTAAGNGSSADPMSAMLPHGQKADDRNEHRAMESLKLLEGLGGTQKCAIYSLDIHPKGQKFATGGGDGTVRIWNAGALFAQQRQQQQQQQHGKTKVQSSQYKEGGAYESSGESSGAEDSHGATTAADEGSGSDSSAAGGGEDGAVHDLTSVVRRKKGGAAAAAGGGTTPSKLPTTPETSEQATTPSSSKPPHHHSHHGHNHHRLLCTLSAHTGSSVLAVRFSTNGQYLASAGDDAAVCIYAPASNASATTTSNGGNLDSSVEHWTRIKLGRGHALDVVGLAWAPDDSHLVSCSLDSNAPIIVWKLTDLASSHHRPTHSNVLINPYKILGKGIHTSTVKGVTFDPAGTYLASSGDDPSVCVWRAHDDWGLEKRIDSNSGIFRRWNENDSHALSSQSLFRRLSWSTDGAYICSTNAVVKNKHVASTISREGWAVSSAKSTASGAANLVGHKQPVVACRHCPLLLDARAEGDNGDDEEPEYATLLALGDKRGFVTVWSTRKARPIFKIQCSETRCTVTDLAWGPLNDNEVMLLVSLLDGQVVALKFGVPDELGKLLRPEEQARVFQMRYGIDLNETDMGHRRLFVGENSGPKLIENALQYTLEDEEEENEDDGPIDMEESTAGRANNRSLTSAEVRASQSESRSKGGKKRIQPLLMSVDAPPAKVAKASNGTASGAVERTSKKKVDNLDGAMELAEQAASGAEAAAATQKQSNNAQPAGPLPQSPAPGQREPTSNHASQNHPAQVFAGIQSATRQIPHSTDRIHSVELPIDEPEASGDGTKFVADCTNSIQIPLGSKGSALPCATLSISRSGQNLYKDQIHGTSCSAIAASRNLLAVGTVDGCVQLYGTSPSLGWKSGAGFRSHPPFVFGRPIVALKLHKYPPEENGKSKTEMLVVSADGSFGVYTLDPGLKVRYKGTIMPPMSHMLLSSDMSNELHLPKLTRIQLTDTNRLLLLLALQPIQNRSNQDERSGSNNNPSVGAGGSLQAFVYDSPSELWMRVADSRFVLSDFYFTLPSLSRAKKIANGELSKLDDSVRLGATSSSLKTSRRRNANGGGHADRAYEYSGEAGSDMTTRSHCEDRMACAVALNSESEFEYWLSLYARTLAMSGNEASLRVLVDMLAGKALGSGSDGEIVVQTPCWWLSEAPNVLSLDRMKLIKTIVIPEMSKNRALQRITNEIALEVNP